MNKSIKRVRKYFSRNFEVSIATIILVVVLISSIDFYKAIILMLEFIVIMEVVKMISDFIKKETLRLRYVIDIFIIFLIRDVIILSTNKNKDYFDISFLIIVILAFFLFRILAIKFSPAIIEVSKDTITTKEQNCNE